MDRYSKPSQSTGGSNSKEPCLLTERGDATEMYVAMHLLREEMHILKHKSDQ